MSAKTCVMVLVAMVAVPALAVAQSEWVDGPVNPVIPPPDAGAWDGHRYAAGVVKVDGIYHLTYIGQLSSSWAGDDFQNGHATSSDGVVWELDPANPVLRRGDPGAWDDVGAALGAVIHDGTEFRLWFSGCDGQVCRVGYATSPDGSVWTKYAGNPILDVGDPGSFDDTFVLPGSVILHDGVYRMWYTAGQNMVGPGDFDWRVGYAWSDDGLIWIKRPEPVLGPRPGNDRMVVSGLNVVFDGSGYHMWYFTDEDTPGSGSIAYAVSPDGIEWTRYPWNPVVGGGSGPCAVLRDQDSGEYTMWYTDQPGLSIRRATSECCSTVYGSFIPAAAYAAGAQGSFFRTDLDLSNAEAVAVAYELWWLPRGEDNSEPNVSDSFSLGAGMSVRYANVLAEVFGLEPDALGALAIASSSPYLLAMSRTYNSPGDGASGTYGQAMPAITPDGLIRHGERRRILFGTENDDMRTNIGCQNATAGTVYVDLELFDVGGTSLATERMILPPLGNDQINRIFEDYAPVNGYVEVWTPTVTGAFYCYGSVLDNLTSDPTTIPPM